MNDLINEFLAETREMLNALSGAIVAWEANPGDRERLDEIFRFLHTVKGNCGFFDLPRLQQLSHAAEDALAEVRSGRRVPDHRLVNAVLGVIDRIGELIQALETGEAVASEDDEQLIASLSGQDRLTIVEPEVAPAPTEARRASRSVRLSVDLLDRMMSSVSDAVLARNEMARRLRDRERDPEVHAAFERVSASIGEIREAITRTRMQRIESLFAALPRMVRDLASELGREVRLEMDGGDVELDREMIEMIRDPLTHIIRNSIDHGIESPADRREKGKRPAGHLRVSARQAGNQILIEVSDDGRGIDGESLVSRAIGAGLLTPEQADRLAPQERNDLVFLPGLSTAGEVTAISGRGVGMDVVRANVERIGGIVELDSRLGEGVRLCMRVPLTLTIIPALCVSAGGQIFAIPRSAIEELLRETAVEIHQVGTARVATIRGRRLPLADLRDLLGLEDEAPAISPKVILLKPAGGDVYALRVDAVHDHEELVVKPAAPAVMAAGVYAGTTLADDGRPILLLDPSGMATSAGFGSTVEAIEPRGETGHEARQEAETSLLLLRTLDDRLRAINVSAVERIEEVPSAAVAFSAGRLRVSMGGTIIPLAGCDAPPATDRLRILRLTDGTTEIGYAFSEVIDIRSVAIQAHPAAAPAEVAAVALVDGEQVELIDPHWLFSRFGDGAKPADAPVCALPPGDPWTDNLLRPLIESLGYQVVAAEPGIAADLLIENEACPVPPGVSAAGILKLRDKPEKGGDGDESVYRYDREAIVDILRRRREAGNG